jgi:hypothetical protein
MGFLQYFSQLTSSKAGVKQVQADTELLKKTFSNLVLFSVFSLYGLTLRNFSDPLFERYLINIIVSNMKMHVGR